MNDNIEILTPKELYVKEDFSQFNFRYSGSCKNFYRKLNSELPEIFSKLIFYRNFTHDDSFAEFLTNELSFVVQLDPDCQVIVLFNNETTVEFSVYDNKDDETENLALDFIKKTF